MAAVTIFIGAVWAATILGLVYLRWSDRRYERRLAANRAYWDERVRNISPLQMEIIIKYGTDF